MFLDLAAKLASLMVQPQSDIENPLFAPNFKLVLYVSQTSREQAVGLPLLEAIYALD